MTKTRVAFLGDSLTQGTFSYNWIEYVAGKLKNPPYVFYNHGVNGEMAYNALKRIEKVVKENPDLVTILLGTNDVFSIATEENTKRYMRGLKLPQAPSLKWYVENLEEIVRTLQKRTNARIALISIPVLGEDPKHPVYIKAKEYVNEIKRIAKEYKIDYLPLHETMEKYLQEHSSHQRISLYTGLSMMFWAYIKRKLLFYDWDKISRSNKLLLTTDTIHLNSISGKMLGDLVIGFIKKNDQSNNE